MLKKIWKNFGSFTNSQGNKETKTVSPMRRRLFLESLEERDLLCVSPLQGVEIEEPHSEPQTTLLCPGCAPYDPERAAKYEGVSASPELPQGAPPYSYSETFKLNSLPGSNYTIYLDFTGHTTTGTGWNTMITNNEPIVTPPFSLSLNDNPDFSNRELEMIQYIWQRVSEDYIPFNVNVTTQEPALSDLIRSDANDPRWGIRVAIGGTSNDWFEDSGGVAFLGSFNWDSDTPCFVFPYDLLYDEKSIAEAVSHEVGHTFGLNHDGQRGFFGHGEYYFGDNGWAPIMGAGYYEPVTQWSKGEYLDATNQEDDLAIIARSVPYRADDHGSTRSTATPLEIDNSKIFVEGIIERNTDIDYFRLYVPALATMSLDIIPGTRDANLDVLAKIYDSSGRVIYTADPQDTLSAHFEDIPLDKGFYYISVEGTGRKNGVYSKYGSIGAYTISGTILVEHESNAPPMTENFVSTYVTGATVSLSWSPSPRALLYSLQYRLQVGKEEDWINIITNETEYTITGLDYERVYVFRILGFNAAGQSLWTQINVRTEIVVPLVPGNFACEEKTNTSAVFTWEESLGAKEYVIRYQKPGEEQWTEKTFGEGVFSATIPELEIDTDYVFQLQARTSAGGSEWSELELRTLPNLPQMPQGLQAEETTVEVGEIMVLAVRVSWEEVENATDYDIEYQRPGDPEWKPLFQKETTCTIPGLSGNTTYHIRVRSSNAAGHSEWNMIEITTEAAAPEVPGNFRSPEQTHQSISLAWDSSEGAESYVLRYKRKTETEWETPLEIKGFSTTVPGLIPQCEYEFQLKAVGPGGESEWVSREFSTKIAPPITPGSIRSTEIFWNRISLSWTASPGASGYVLQYKKSDESTWRTAPTLSETTTTIENLDPETAYMFRVQAFNTSGGSGYANAEATTKIAPPEAPGKIEFSDLTMNSVLLSWPTAERASGYALQYRKLGESDWTVLPDQSKTSAPITNLAEETTYIFRVRALNESGESTWTSIEIKTAEIRPPATPEDFRVLEKDWDFIALSWAASRWAEQYQVRYRKAGETTWRTQQSTTQTQILFGSLAPGTSYDFQIRAVNSKGESSWTEFRDSTSPAPLPVAIVHCDNPQLQDGCETRFSSEESYDQVGTSLVYLWDLDNNGSFETEGIEVWFSTDLLGTDDRTTHTIRHKVRNTHGWESEIVEYAVRILPTSPSFSISAPSEEQMQARTPTYWDFSATAAAFRPIVKWDIHWGDGSENTEILGGPRSEVIADHFYREPGTYNISITTTDIDGFQSTVSYTSHTVKEKREVVPTVAENGVAVESTPEIYDSAAIFPATIPESVIGESEETGFSAAAPLGNETTESVASGVIPLAVVFGADFQESFRIRTMLDLDESGKMNREKPLQNSSVNAIIDQLFGEEDAFHPLAPEFAGSGNEEGFLDEELLEALLG